MSVGLLDTASVSSTPALPSLRGALVSEQRYLTTADVAALLGVAPDTVRSYRARSKPGGTYASNPFPEPDVVIGKMPVWYSERAPEIKKWNSARVGRGVGGGRPPSRN